MKHLLLTTIAAMVVATTALAGPIHTAAMNGDLAGVQAELDKGVDVDVDVKDEDGNSSLHWGATKGHKEVVELLIDQGADLDSKDESGMTPLHVAKNKAIAELLITKGADVNEANKMGETPLDLAGFNVGDHTYDLRLKHGGKHGSIHTAAEYGHIEGVKEFLTAGADVNAKRDDSKTPLDLAETVNEVSGQFTVFSCE